MLEVDRYQNALKKVAVTNDKLRLQGGKKEAFETRGMQKID